MKSIWWFDAVNEVVLVGSVLINIYLWFKAKTDKRFELMAATLATVSERVANEAADRKANIAAIDKRVALLEARFDAIPTHDDLNSLRQAVTDIGSTVARIEERSSFTTDSVRRIEKHLLHSS